MQTQVPSDRTKAAGHKFFYGWIIVAACTLMIALTYGLMYSYSVFFKPLADYFSWDRATVSLIYSASLIVRGIVSIGVGWLADRYGPIRVSAFCGSMIGLGLILSSRVGFLWQFFLTYAVMEAIGLSGAFGIGTAMVSRWFTKNRGLAIGIISTGSGLGTLLIVPTNERLVSILSWSNAFVVCGAAAGVLMFASAFLLRQPPASVLAVYTKPEKIEAKADNISLPVQVNLGQALKDYRMILYMGALFFFFFGIQIIMVHLVNYATDMGMSALIAAALISIIGAVSIAGRLLTGVGAEKIGLHRTLALTRVFLVISFACLIFFKAIWSFYVFALIFGLCYGGEVPQIPLFIGKYWGTRIMATLVGLNLFVTSLGGALGPWLAGIIFDATRSYQGAFVAGMSAGLASLTFILILRGKTAKQGQSIY